MLHVYLVEASGWADGEFVHVVSDYHQSLEDCYDDLAEVPSGCVLRNSVIRWRNIINEII